jgi:hypothetical protein
MRVFYVAIVVMAAIGGAGGIRAAVVGTGPAAINPSAADRTMAGGMALAPNGIRPRPGLGGPAGENATSLAQLFPALDAPEATTGNPTLAPLKWVGLLVAPDPTAPTTKVALCSAQFITPKVVLTAGHCLKNLQDSPTGPWIDLTKQTFWLQYQNQEGTPFHVVCGATNPLWALPSNYTSLTADQQGAALLTAFEHDFAMLLMDAPSTTGVMPYALDWKGKVTSVLRVGYPGSILGGAIVQQTLGVVFFSNAIPLPPYTQMNLVVQWAPVTDFTQGSSGGAWIANANTTEGPNNNILVAVTSFNNLHYPGAMFGAYLTAAEFNPLLTFVSNGCK